jgi:hypothetical protein
MGIKKYIADKDNTITNAYGSDLLTRSTGSNMGASDILEVFSLYGQGGYSTSSVELSRALVGFPVSTISADRTAGTIPVSGSVSFYLRMYNARHGEQLPRDLILNVLAVSQSWEEGTGLDMEGYTDKTKDAIAGSNWKNASSTIAKATLTDAIDVSGVAQNDAFTMTVPSVAGGDGVAHQFVFDNHTDITNLTDTTGFGINIQHASDDAAIATVLVKAINGYSDALYQYGGAALDAESTLAAGTMGVTASIGSTTSKVTLTMVTAGSAGNVANVLSADTNFAEGSKLLVTAFTDGDGPWANIGGHYHTSTYIAGETMPSYTSTFAEGDEDMLVDVTAAVEEWIAEKQENYGFGVFVTSSQEAHVTASDSYVLANTSGQKTSYYTKRFFSRTSEFFFKKPAIEARWDSRKMDNRGNFYYSSSLAPAQDNLNTLYLYNYVRGQLVNIPAIGTGKILLSIYSGSSDDTAPSGSKLQPSRADAASGNGFTGDTTNLNITGGYVSTGVYSASFAFTGSTSLKTIYDVWHSGTIEYSTGSIKPLTLSTPSWNQYSQYTSKITNLKPKYSKEEKARFRAAARPRNFSPTIYTVAKSEIESTIIQSASYEIIRMIDNATMIDHSTGSTTYHTFLSYDKSGSYFDLDMTLLEPGYLYGIKLAYYISEGWREQEEVFKFRVEDN